MKKYLILSAIFLGLVLVGAVSYVEPFTNNVDVNDYNISNADWISANYFNGTLTGESEADMNWTFNQNYPAACPGSSAITKLNDSVTCSDLWVDVAGDTMTGDFAVNNTFYVNATSNKVGIWTTSPDDLLHLKQTTDNVFLKLETAGSRYTGIYFNNEDPAGRIMYYHGDDSMQFDTKSKFTFEGGEFGIGLTSPTEKLHVAGNIFLQNDSDKLFFGQAKDVSISYDGSNTLFTNEVGSGDFIFPVFRVGSGIENYGRIVWNATADYLKLYTVENGTVYNNILILKKGNVGIGAIDPVNKLNVIGDGNFTGNVTAENVYLPAYLRVASNSTIPVIGISNWTNITFSKQAPSLKENIEHTWNDSTNTTITINDAGVYQISYSISIQDTSALPTAHVAFRLMDGGNPIQGSYSEIDTSKQNEEIFIHSSFITSFEAGGTAHLQFTASDVDVSVIPHGTYQTSPSSAQISINKISN